MRAGFAQVRTDDCCDFEMGGTFTNYLASSCVFHSPLYASAWAVDAGENSFIWVSSDLARFAESDVDAIMRTVSGISDVIARFAEENDLPADWINSDFIKTSSYSSKLYAVSKHFCFLNNDTLEIRTVTGVHLIAMKARAHREYRNDVSDIIGIMIEERMAGTKIDYSDISEAYQYLYGEEIDPELKQILSAIAEKDVDELEKEYRERKELETQVNSKMVTYIENGVEINAENADTVIARIKEKQERH